MNDYERRHRLSIKIKEQYPPGTRVLLNQMNDPYHPVESGTRGTVMHVDDQANMHMKWDNGRTLALDPELDSFRKLTGEEIAEEKHPRKVVDFGDDLRLRCNPYAFIRKSGNRRHRGIEFPCTKARLSRRT